MTTTCCSANTVRRSSAWRCCERKAAFAILSALDSTEGLLVASKIADQVKITRSVIVNALRKFESAGVISSKSLGMKGTYIKVLNEYLLDEVQKLRNE